MYRTVTVKLPDRALAAIDAEARARRVTRSTVLRERIEHAAAGRGSAWDRMRDLVIDAPVPADLATHGRHLRGYGRSRPR